MFRPRIFVLAALVFIFVSPAKAQDSIRILDPQSLSSSGSGWSVSPSTGRLGMNIPFTTVPGDISIVLSFQFMGSHSTETRRVTNPNWDPNIDPQNLRYMWESHDRPVHGGVSFGCITSATTYDSYIENGSYILEDGNQFRERDFTAYSNPSALSAPGEFQLGPKTWSQVRTHVSSRTITYDATGADLGSWATKAASLTPVGFLPGTTGYKVIMDKDRARIFAYVADFQAWVPILWLDRFGHSASFQWMKGTNGNITVFSVKALNQGIGQPERGVQMQWAVVPTADTETEQPLLRVDFIGFQAPSIQVSGYSGVTTLNPSALTGLSYNIAPPMACPVLRPTQIVSGNPYDAPLPPPTWISGGLPVPSQVGSDPWAPVLAWTFAYDLNKAEVVSFIDALGATTTFTYANLTFYDGGFSNSNKVRGVNAATTTASSTALQFTRAWTRDIPVYAGYMWTSSVWRTTLTQSYNSGDATDVPTQEWTFAGPDQNAVHYGNGALLSTRLYTAAKTFSNQIFVPGIYGIDGSLSATNRPSLTVDGSPTQLTTTSNDSLTGLPSGEVFIVGGATWKTVGYTYATNFGLLDPGHLTSVDTQILVNGLPVAAPTHTIEYDAATGFPAFDYLQSGSLKRGKSFSYDGEGHLTTVASYPVGIPWVSTTLTPNADGQPTHASTTFSSPNGGITSFTQDWAFSPAGRVTSATDDRGVTTTSTYDSRGRTLTVATPGSPTTTLAYPTEFESDWSTSAGASGSQTTDAFGRLVSRTSPGGITDTPHYDVLGRATVVDQVSGGSARHSSALYDALGRTTHALSYASPLSQDFTYLAEGTSAKVTTTLGNGVASNVWTDPLGQTIKTSDPWSEVNSQYNELGLPTQVTQTADGQNQIKQDRNFGYTPLGDLTSRKEPETGTTTFAGHDAMGNPGTIDDGVRIRTLAFDGLGRLRSVTSSAGSETLSWVFDGLQVKNTSTVSNGQTVTQAYTYKPASEGARLASETMSGVGADQVTGYAYDPQGRLDTLTYPSGHTVVKYSGYDSLSRVGSVTQNSIPLATVHYDPIWGSRSDITFASGAKSSWTADVAGVNLQSWKIAPVGSAAEISSYDVDGNGNLNKGAGWDSMTHDAAGRLTAASGFGETVALSHDGFGNNLTSTTAPAPTGTNNFGFAAMPDNKVPTQTSTPTAVPTGWLYQLNGEATQIGLATGAAVVQGLTWDGLGRMASTGIAGTAWTNTYAPSGMRVQLTDSYTPTNNRRYAYTSDGLLLSEYAQTGASGHASAKAAKVFHRSSGGGDISRSLGSFVAGETVTVSAWFKAPPGVSGSIYLTDNVAPSATDNKKSVAMQGNGDWQQLSLTLTVTQFANLNLHLYGDMYTSTSANATDSTFVAYDDVQVASSTRGTLLAEDFEAGTTAWAACSGNLFPAQPDAQPTTWKRDVIYLGNEAIAEVDAAGVHELHNDHLGSPRVITSGTTGAVEGRQVFGPYGERLGAYTSGYTPITGYTGHLQQDPSGLIYMRGRFYSPAWHRFLNSDQGADPGSWNQFAYTGGSPFMGIDPSGMDCYKTLPDGRPERDEHGGLIPCGEVGGSISVTPSGPTVIVIWIPNFNNNFPQGSPAFRGGGLPGMPGVPAPQSPSPQQKNPCADKIKALQQANDAGKKAADSKALKGFFRNIGVGIGMGALAGGAYGGEAGAAVGLVVGVGIGAAPGAGLGALTGALVGGIGGFSGAVVTTGPALRNSYDNNSNNWQQNYNTIQNYSNIGCNGEAPPIRY